MKENKLSRQAIGDGIYLNWIENDRSKNNFVTLYFVTGLDRKSASYNTVLSRVLTRGSEHYPTQMLLNRALDHAYDATLEADTAKIGEWHALSVGLTLLDNAFIPQGEDLTEEGLRLLEDVVLHPYLPEGVFDPEYVAGEKRLALFDLEARINQKARYARERLMEVMCKLEPYSTCALGHAATIRSITPESLTAYYRELLHSARIEIFFVGRFNQEAVTRQMTELFAPLPRCCKELPLPSIRTKAKSVREVTERMDIAQANLAMGFRTGTTVYDEDLRAFSLYNSVLGGSLTSKLFCVLREKMSLCYTVASSPDALKGVMLIYAGIAPENRDVAVKEALNQMEEIRLGNVTSEEMESARGALKNALKGLEDNPAGLSDWYLPKVLTNRIETPEAIVEELDRVTLEDVVRVSEKITLDTVYALMPQEEKA